MATVTGDIEDVDGVLKITRINVHYSLKVPEEKRADALEALENYPYTPQAYHALQRAVYSSRLRLSIDAHDSIASVFLSKDGTKMLSAAQDGMVKIKQTLEKSKTGTAAAWGALWGLLIGLLFLSPIFWGLVGGLLGAVIGKTQDLGIDNEFIKEVGDSLEPGKSAL